MKISQTITIAAGLHLRGQASRRRRNPATDELAATDNQLSELGAYRPRRRPVCSGREGRVRQFSQRLRCMQRAGGLQRLQPERLHGVEKGRWLSSCRPKSVARAASCVMRMDNEFGTRPNDMVACRPLFVMRHRTSSSTGFPLPQNNGPEVEVIRLRTIDEVVHATSMKQRRSRFERGTRSLDRRGINHE